MPTRLYNPHVVRHSGVQRETSSTWAQIVHCAMTKHSYERAPRNGPSFVRVAGSQSASAPDDLQGHHEEKHSTQGQPKILMKAPDDLPGLNS